MPSLDSPAYPTLPLGWEWCALNGVAHEVGDSKVNDDEYITIDVRFTAPHHLT
jgi:hypothetical protein